MIGLRTLLERLRRDRSGVSVIEFALMLPTLTFIGMYGIEIAYMSSVNMSVSQMALSLADNASRMEQTNNNTVPPTVTEADVNSIMQGAITQGASIKFSANGRVVLSSLEKQSSGAGKQYIHWQRCKGSLSVQSAYGNDTTTNGLSGPAITSMGQGATKITANAGTAVMFVEVFYDYKGLFGTMFVQTTRFRQEAAYIVRDVRDLREGQTSGLTGTGSTSQCT